MKANLMWIGLWANRFGGQLATFCCTQSIQEHGAQTALAMVDFRGEKWPYSQFRMDCEGLSWFETLRIHAQILGDRPFLTTLDLAARVETVQLTFARAHSLASHAAHLLQTSPKFKLGDRVLILHESTKELGLATLACFFAGAVAGASSACSLIPCDAGFLIYIKLAPRYFALKRKAASGLFSRW